MNPDTGRTPTVSVIIPAHNAERTAGRALSSVQQQTYSDIVDVIVVDDGSTDGTADVVRSGFPDAQLFRLPNPSGGPGLPRNEGLKYARGDYIAYLDADDEWYPGKIEAQVEVLRRMPGTSLVTSFPDIVRNQATSLLFASGEPSPVVQATLRDWLLRTPRIWGGIYPSGWLVRREVLEAVGPFLSAQSQDLEYMLRLTGQGYSVQVLARPTYRYYAGAGNITSDPARKGEGVRRVISYLRQVHPVEGADWARGTLSGEEYTRCFRTMVLRFMPVLAAHGCWEVGDELLAESFALDRGGPLIGRTRATYVAWSLARRLLRGRTAVAGTRWLLSYRQRLNSR